MLYCINCIFCLHYTKPTPKHTHHRKLSHFYILCMTLVWFISCYFQGDQKCPHKDKNFRYWHRYGDIVPIMLGLAGHTLSHIDTHTHTHIYLSIYIYPKKISLPCGLGSSQPQSQPQEATAAHQSMLLSWEFPSVSHGQHSHTAGQQHPGFTRIKYLIIAKQHKWGVDSKKAQWKHSCATM